MNKKEQRKANKVGLPNYWVHLRKKGSPYVNLVPYFVAERRTKEFIMDNGMLRKVEVKYEIVG